MPPEIDHAAESVLVQLTRMEGKLDRVADRVDDLRQRVDVHDGDITTLKSTTQRLDEQATAEQAKAVALAAALKEAEATRRQKSEQSWTPWQRIGGALGGAIAFGAFLVGLFAVIKS